MNFKELQRQWYDKLAKEGFQDIEATSASDNFELHRFSAKFTPDAKTILFRERKNAYYYRQVGFFLHDHSFESEFERDIWRHHADGISMRKIASLHHCTTWRIFTIISRLKRIMCERRYEDRED